MKKALVLCNSSFYLYSFRKEIIQALSAEGYSVYLSTPNDGFFEELKTLEAETIETKMNRRGTNPLSDMALFLNYRRMVRKVKPDVIVTYSIKPNIYGNIAAKGYGVPVVSVVTGLGETFVYNNLVNKIVKIMYCAAFKSAIRIIFLNAEDMKIMCDNKLVSGQEYLLSSGEGVDLEAFSFADYAEENETVSFLYLGRVMRPKGIMELIEASRCLRMDGSKNCTVTLIGYYDGNIKKEVEEAEKEGIIQYAGFQSDVKAFIKKAHCIVLPSYYKEGVPISLMEAAAMGRPIIATDISGCREVVDDGINGYLCKPRDVGSLHACMKRFMELPGERRAEMGRASRRKAEAEFDRKAVVDILLKLIQDAVK